MGEQNILVSVKSAAGIASVSMLKGVLHAKPDARSVPLQSAL